MLTFASMNVRHQLNIAVICGGPSKEASVSRSTAKGIVAALQENFSSVHLIELDKHIDKNLRKIKPDVVFPAVHGKWGEDGYLQGLLTLCGVPFVGSNMEASVLAMDKTLAKQILLHGLPVAKSMVVTQKHPLEKTAREIIATFHSEVVIKPACEGSGLGISFVSTAEEARNALEMALSFGPKAIVEERIIGAEILTTAAVLERDTAEALPVIEIKTPPGTWYDYEHRYTPGLSEHVIASSSSGSAIPQSAGEVALLAHHALGCRDLSRADFVVPPMESPFCGNPTPSPGMTQPAYSPTPPKPSAFSFPALVKLLVERAAAEGDYDFIIQNIDSQQPPANVINDGCLQLAPYRRWFGRVLKSDVAGEARGIILIYRLLQLKIVDPWIGWGKID